MGVVVRKGGTGKVMQKTRVARRSGRTRVFTHAIAIKDKWENKSVYIFI